MVIEACQAKNYHGFHVGRQLLERELASNRDRRMAVTGGYYEACRPITPEKAKPAKLQLLMKVGSLLPILLGIWLSQCLDSTDGHICFESFMFVAFSVPLLYLFYALACSTIVFTAFLLNAVFGPCCVCSRLTCASHSSPAEKSSKFVLYKLCCPSGSHAERCRRILILCWLLTTLRSKQHLSLRHHQSPEVNTYKFAPTNLTLPPTPMSNNLLNPGLPYNLCKYPLKILGLLHHQLFRLKHHHLLALATFAFPKMVDCTADTREVEFHRDVVGR